MANAINSLSYNSNTYVLTLPYGVCSTDENVAAKVVSVDNFSLETGAVVIVKFSNANKASSPTLNVNSSGAKSIKRYGTTSASTGNTTSGWAAGSVQMFVFDGTNWVRDYWYNTTYKFDTLSSSANTLTVKVLGTEKTTTLVNSVSNTWTAGTTRGPSIKTTVNGVAGSATAIPAASGTNSGIVTTGAQTFTGTKTFNAGLIVSGKAAGGGDDEGVVVSPASNNYAGITLGDPSGVRTTLYLMPSTSTHRSIWRHNNGSGTYDITHPETSGEVVVHTADEAQGSASLPVYVNASGVITSCTKGSVFSALSWTGGTTSGPVLNVTVATQSRTATIPAASSTASGIITTGTQTFGGDKTFSGVLNLASNKYIADSTCGLDCHNSDIKNANGIYFGDACNGAGEGINFYRSSTAWDSLYAASGNLYFHPDRATATVGDGYKIVHSGNTAVSSNSYGYYCYIGSILIQWGTAAVDDESSSSSSITLPVSYSSSTSYTVIGSPGSNSAGVPGGDWYIDMYPSEKRKIKFYYGGFAYSGHVRWMTIGY